MIKKILGIDFFFTIDKSLLDQSKWQEGMRMLGRASFSDWDTLGEYVLIDGTTDTVPEQLIAWLNNPEVSVEELQIDERYYNCSISQLQDVAKKNVGQIIFMADHTEKKLNSVLTSIIFAGILLAGGFLLILALAVFVGRLEKELKKSYEELELRVEERTSELSAANDELIKARDRAEEASKAKSQFLSSMSHELRTPLNAIIGMSEVLADADLDEKYKQFIQILNSSGESLLAIINDILDISKIEAGQMALECTPFDLPLLIEETSDMLAVRAHKKNIDLAVRVHPQVPQYVSGDPFRLRQILINLVGNAVKFTEQGYVLIEVGHEVNDNQAAPQEEKVPGDFLSLTFNVKDSGIGIPDEKISSIFESFTQVDSSTTRKYGGTGLGLGISQRLVTMMGGKLQVESKVGLGSVFRFTVPLKKEPKLDLGTSQGELNLNGCRILVVDDIEVNRLIVREMIQGWGGLVQEAEGGSEALKLLQKSKTSGQPFDLVLLDYWMPEMDGLEVARRITNSLDKNIPQVLLLTSDYLPIDIKAKDEAGILAHLVKPVKRKELKRILGMLYAGQSVSHKSQPKNSAAIELPEAEILVVEDSPHNQTVIRAYLENTAVKFEFADNGQIGVNKFKMKDYDLVLMDMQMPVMDGFTATAEIRKLELSESKSPVPIIVLSAYALSEDIEKCRQAGCNSHMAKPIRKAEFYHMLQSVLADKPNSSDAHDQKTESNLEKLAIQPNTPIAHVEPELVQFAREFLHSQDAVIAQIANCLAQDDFSKIQKLGHTMKGEGGGFGFDYISELGAKIEAAAKENDKAPLEPLLSQLQEYLATVEIMEKQS